MTSKDQENKWMEFSLLLPPELADRTAEALTGIFESGVAREREFEAVFPGELDQVTAPIRIFGYFPLDEEPNYRDRIEKALAPVVPDTLAPVFSALEEKNWAAAWQDRYQPIPVGERLIIVPSWLENPEPERTEVLIDPGMAFGSGTHPTTRLTLHLLERAVIADQPSRVIDVGCGSGILSIAAAKLGVSAVLGVDNDPDAIKVSRENAKLNKTSEICDFKEWSVAELLAHQVESRLVVANIIAPILSSLFSEGLAGLVSGGGILILSGILEEQLPGIKDHLRKENFLIKDELEDEGWFALWGEKNQQICPQLLRYNNGGRSHLNPDQQPRSTL